MDFFLKLCHQGNLIHIQQWYNAHPEIILSGKILQILCDNNNIDCIKWIYSLQTSFLIEINHFRNCEQGHVLEAFTTTQSDFTCDICDTVQLCGTSLHGCRECDFDVCASCRFENPFCYCCRNGLLDIAKWIYQTNTHERQNKAFHISCQNGHLDVAKWLHSLGDVNIHILEESPFRVACQNGHIDMAKWLDSLGDVDIHILDESPFCVDRGIAQV